MYFIDLILLLVIATYCKAHNKNQLATKSTCPDRRHANDCQYRVKLTRPLKRKSTEQSTGHTIDILRSLPQTRLLIQPWLTRPLHSNASTSHSHILLAKMLTHQSNRYHHTTINLLCTQPTTLQPHPWFTISCHRHKHWPCNKTHQSNAHAWTQSHRPRPELIKLAPVSALQLHTSIQPPEHDNHTSNTGSSDQS